MRGFGIIKVITVGYSGLDSQCINSLAHAVSAAPQCVGDRVPITCTLLRIARDINGAASAAPRFFRRATAELRLVCRRGHREGDCFFTIASRRDEAQEGGETVENKSRSDILGKDAGVKGQTKGEETGCDTKASADVCSFP